MLELREFKQLVDDHFSNGVAFKLDDDAHTVTVRLVLHMGNTLNTLIADLFRDFLDQVRFVYLIGNFSDDDSKAVFADFLDMVARPHRYRAFAR